MKSSKKIIWKTVIIDGVFQHIKWKFQVTSIYDSVIQGDRCNIACQNKVGKCNLYAILEIFLVIVGIFIVVALNHRNGKKKLDAQMETYRTGLTEALGQGSVYQNIIRKTLSRKWESIFNYLDSLQLRILNHTYANSLKTYDFQGELYIWLIHEGQGLLELVERI